MALSGCGTAYDLSGPEDAPVVVLIHGLGRHRQGFFMVLDCLVGLASGVVEPPQVGQGPALCAVRSLALHPATGASSVHGGRIQPAWMAKFPARSIFQAPGMCSPEKAG